MTNLKLIALEPDDLEIISANLQDAVLTAGDMTYRPAEKRFVMLANRFDWLSTEAGRANGVAGERHRSALRIERVLGAKISGLDRGRPDLALELLALQFEAAAEPPAGHITLVFAGAAAIRLEVECVEVGLEDIGGSAWLAKRPRHDADDPAAA